MRKKRPIERVQKLERDASLIIIASEDRYAVKQYFEFFESTRIQFRVLETDDGKSSPQYVMERLAQFIDEYNFGEGDQFWLVCDTDHWIEPNHIQKLREVLRLCNQKEINVALSNPCFDLWLLLHFTEKPTESSLSCQDIEHRLRTTVGQYQKTKVYNLPIKMQHVRDAIRRSSADSPRNSDLPDALQTDVYLIIEDLIARGVISIPD